MLADFSQARFIKLAFICRSVSKLDSLVSKNMREASDFVAGSIASVLDSNVSKGIKG